MKNIIGIIAPAIILITSFSSMAADSLSGKYPKVVLFQLRSEHNRIEALTKARKYTELEEVIKDAREVTARIHLDFHDNFDYCPVYYYMDTNAKFVQNKQFEGVLLNADGTPATNIPINSSSDDYIIVYYGYPVSQARADRVLEDSSRYIYDPQPVYGRGLVMLNDKFLQIGYMYKLDADEFLMNKKRRRVYSYYSAHFDIEYSGLAASFNRKLKERIRNRRGFGNHKVKK